MFRRILSTFLFVFSLSLLHAADLYWVGGTGDWSDPRHWAERSGGPSSGRIPGQTDDVHFDEQSGIYNGKIYLTGDVRIHDMYVSASGITFSGQRFTTMQVSGDFFLRGNASFHEVAAINLNPAKSARFSPGNNLLTLPIYISSGIVELQSVYLSTSDLEIGEGKFISSGMSMQVRSIEVTSNKGEADLSGSFVLLQVQPDKKSLRRITTFNTSFGKSSAGINAIDSVTATVTAPLCNTSCDGSIQVQIYSTSGGPFSAALTGPQSCNPVLTPTAFGATGACLGICNGTFLLTVTDSSDGSQTQQFVVVTAPPPMGTTFPRNTPTCNGDCNGWIYANVIGGTAPYAYSWNTLPAQTGDTATNLCAGSYSVTVTDANGCFQTFTTTLAQPAAILPNPGSTNVSCNGSCDGTATLVPSGGNPPFNYTYNWTSTNPPFNSTNQNINALCPGTYVITITDDSLCTGVDSVVITEPMPLALNPASTNVSCGGACDGTASINPTGGTPQYNVVWSIGGTGNVQTNLCDTSLSVVVTDQNGCTDSANFVITEPQVLMSNSTSTDVTCNGACDGTATSTPSGGTSPFSFSWSNGVNATGLTSTISGLCPGSYNVIITDANGCQDTGFVTITEPPVLGAGITHTDVTCFGLCDGTASVAITGGTPQYTILWSNGATTPSIGALCDTTIWVQVTDSNNCVATDTIAILEPPLLTVSVVDDTVSCNGICNGVLTATVNGGTPTYTYSWSNGSSSASNNGLCLGTYIVTVSDSNSCTATDTGEVVNPVPITASLTATPASCAGVCDATATVTPSGGFPPYTIVWCNGQTGTTATGLCGGTTCSVTITDAQGCSITQQVNIVQPSPITSVMNVTNILCNGECSGSATVTPAGGTPPYLISWNTLPVQGGNTISNLCMGTYVATITDANGCTYTDTAIITEPLPLQPNLVTTNVSCFGQCDGTASLNPTGGVAPYSYTWSNGLPAVSNQNNLCAGTYSVIITDANNCSDTIPVTITQPNPLNASVININASCGSVCDGSASVLAGGGTPPYTYLWNTNPAQTNDTAVNLCVGNYSVTVTDVNGCTITLPATITPVVFISINATGGQPSCFGACDGQATATASGGATPYTYSWSNGQNTQSATGLCGGVMYYVTATDANGCANTDSIILSQPNPINVSFSVTNAQCGNICDGTAIATGSGGTTPYSYAWSNGQNTATATNLCSGTFYVTVTDANGCSTLDSVVIASPPLIVPNATITDATCNNADGSILLAPTGGVAPYSYSWQAPPSTANPLSNIPAGVYTVIISDASACSDTFAIVVNNINGPQITTTTTPATCPGGCDGTATASPSGGTPGYTYLWTPSGQTTQTASALCAGVYAVTVTDALGCATSVFDTITEPTPILSNASISDITCNAFCDGSISLNPTGGTGPYTFSWTTGQNTGTINNLCPGTFIVTITDAAGCTVNDTFVVGNQTVIQANQVVTHVDCNGACNGAISLNPTGGNAPYTYTWSPSGPNAPTNTGLCAGNYSVTITDALGCNSISNFTITEPSPITLAVNATNVSCAGQSTGSISISPSGGSGSYSYFWLPGGQTTPVISGLTAGSYTVTVCDAATPGCCVTQTISIAQPPVLTTTASGTDLSCFNSCDGTLLGMASGGTAPYTYTWIPGGLTGSTQSNVCAGTYILQVSDASGCSASDTIQLNQPSQILGNQVISQVSCNGACDGSITLNPTGGSGPYTYLWSPGNLTSQNLSGLCPGAYSVTITDVNGCSNTLNFNITQPNPISAAINASPATCGAFPCDGTISIIPNGGTGGPYAVTWSNGATGTTLNSLCAGLYVAYITDNSGCMDSLSVPLNNLNGPATSHIFTDATCNGSCNGSATVSAVGPNNPFTFLWSPGGSTSAVQSNLCAGTYNVQVTDTLGCVSFEPVVISEPLPIQGNPVITNATCTGICDGSVTMTPTGGNGVFTHSWNTGATTATLANLCPGTYIDSIADGNGCFGIDTISIVVPNPLVLNGTSTNVSCNSACDATATLLITGGTAPFNVSWSNGINQVTNGNTIIGNLCFGPLTASVTDANGCIGTFNYTITEPLPLSAGATVSNITCNGVCDGSVILNISGGTMPYAINWSNGSTATNLNGLCPGTYSVNIVDANGCSSSQSFTITEPAILTASMVATNATCNGNCDGMAIVVPTGGTAPYFYNWSPGGYTNDSISNLCSGTYTVQVTDASGCTFTGSVTITEPPVIQPNFTTTTPPCGVCNGQITIAPTGGSGPPYSALWSTGGTGMMESNLCAGIYTVDITDGSGCTQTFTVGISNVTGPTVTVNSADPSCNQSCDGFIALTASGATPPYTYSWSPGGATTDSIGGLCAGIYFGQVADATGCITIVSDTLTDPPQMQVTPAITDATCGTCNGSAVLTTSGGIGPYSYVWGSGATGSTENNLCAGLYPVQVTDNTGCAVTVNVNVSNSGGPTGEQLVTTNETCLGAADGTATISGVGGTPPYAYLWLPGGQTGGSVSGLSAGSYNVQITDANGCIRTVPVTINAPAALLGNAQVNNATCGVCDGSIILAPTGGTAPYTFAWSNGLPPQANQNGLCAGLYSVVITDAMGCSQTVSIPVNSTNAPLVAASGSSISCSGACDGTITSTVSGGVAPYTYSWSNGQLTPNLSNLCPGVYTLQVTDAAGCAGSTQVTITEPTQMAFSIPSVSDVTCLGNCDGAATVIPSGGSLPYTFNWNPSGLNGQSASGLCAGVHIITVSDTNGCSASQSITIGSTPTLSSTFNSTDATCGQCDGAATVTPVTGTAPFTFLWADGSTGASNTGLCAGVHPVTVTDASGCSEIVNVVINNTTSPTGIITAQTNASCNGATNGSVTVQASGGTPPYSYNWLPGGFTSPSLTNLSAGSYQLQITDANGCQTTVPVTITEPAALTINTIVINSSCNQCNGSGVLQVSGGTQPYSYSWSNGSTAASQNGLCPGVYTVTVTDATGCQSSVTIPVSSTSGPSLSITAAPVNCNGACNGTATVTPSGGSGNYSYLWSPGGQSTASITNLCPGSYYVQVTDNSTGCVSINMATITEPDSINFSLPFAMDATCGGICNGIGTILPTGGVMPYTYSWSNGGTSQTNNALCAGVTSVSVTDANGCTYMENITIGEPTPVVADTVSIVQPSCSNAADGSIDITVSGGSAPYNFNWSSGQITEDVSGLSPGQYTVVVTDAIGCTDTLVIDLLPLTPIQVDAGADTAYCEGFGPALLSASGALTYTWHDLSGNLLGSGATMSVNPGAGTHTYVVVGNSSGCIDQDTVVVTVYAAPVADAGADQSVLAGESVSIGGNPTGPSGSTFYWQPSEGLSSTSVANPVATPTQNMIYHVTVTTPEGCVSTDSVEIIILPEIIFPDGITPNGDGKNDLWIIDNIELFPDCIVEVYNRWGQLIFASPGYVDKWDGTYEGKLLPVGTYYYVIDLRDVRYEPFTGPITIMR